jgi:hypothetical protein
MSEVPSKPAPTRTDLMELRRRLRALPAKERLAAILERPDVMRVVRSLPVQDAFVTLKEVGPTDALEMIELLHPRQVQGVLDLDAWRRDRLDPGTTGEWLELLFSANPARAVKQIMGLDLELLSLLFKLHTRVYDLKEDGDPPEEPALHSITPDQRYLVVYDAGDGRLAHYLKQAVERMFGVDMPFILHLLESVRWETPSSLEEEAFRWRNGRMADLGFLPPGEAQEIFAFLDPDSLAEYSDELGPPPEEEEDDSEPGPDLSTSVLLPQELFEAEGSSVLGQALSGASDEVRRRVSHELVGVGNRLHMAMGGDVGDTEALRATVRLASDTVGIALAYLSQGDPSRISEPLGRLACLTLFRCGYSLPARVARELRARVRAEGSGLDGDGLLRLDAPLREVAAGLLRPQPLFFAGLADPAREDYVSFSSLQQIAQVSHAVTEATFRGELGARALGVDDASMRALGVDDARTGPSSGALVGAWLARVLLAEPTSCAPLDDEALRALRARMDEGGFTREDNKRAAGALGRAAAGLAPLAGARTQEDAEARAEAYAERVLDAIAVELKDTALDDVDGRFVRAVFTTGSLEADPEDDAGEASDGNGNDEER